MSFQLTASAQQDLHAIKAHTFEHWGSDQSQRYLVGLRGLFEILADMPSMGFKRSEIDATTYSFTYKSHVSYYKLSDDISSSIIVFAVLHKNSVPTLHLKNR